MQTLNNLKVFDYQTVMNYLESVSPDLEIDIMDVSDCLLSKIGKSFGYEYVNANFQDCQCGPNCSEYEIIPVSDDIDAYFTHILDKYAYSEQFWNHIFPVSILKAELNYLFPVKEILHEMVLACV